MCVEDHISGCQITAPPLLPCRNPVGTAAGRSAQLGVGIAHSDEAPDSEAGRPATCPGTPGRLTGRGESSASLKLDVKAASPPSAEEDSVQVASATPAVLDGDRLRLQAGNLKDPALGGMVWSKVSRQTSGAGNGRVGEIPAWRELLDSPRYWYDSRIVSRRDDAPRDPLVGFQTFPGSVQYLFVCISGDYIS